MLTVKEIMTANVLTLTEKHTMKNAHDLTQAKGIRHMPILDSQSNKLIGVVTQKVMIAKVLAIISQHGADRLVENEMQTGVMDIATKEFEVGYEAQTVREVADYFLKNKFGCLPILNADEQLVGILTSSDFVRLAVRLLDA